jgi:hypothetical protein
MARHSSSQRFEVVLIQAVPLESKDRESGNVFF